MLYVDDCGGCIPPHVGTNDCAVGESCLKDWADDEEDVLDQELLEGHFMVDVACLWWTIGRIAVQRILVIRDWC